ncbi:hypothetical protein OOT46_16015 [Aquabacterium sp. A7-Y]|uniref:hypothetical protein n=1 Tax=Aquabacterium sp. A7-Y TaxID=1349605 RepID=UPI00223E1180|nr:hypothetical protein [Aquabacterium sp. A7-Y]MCW7539351.1 hypothetical protein [Aquabacterium sp. A7-Y]
MKVAPQSLPKASISAGTPRPAAGAVVQAGPPGPVAGGGMGALPARPVSTRILIREQAEKDRVARDSTAPRAQVYGPQEALPATPLRAIDSGRSPVQQSALQAEIAKAKCFEAGASLSVLDHPGKMGRVFDQYAVKLDTMLNALFAPGSEIGRLPVQFQGRERTLAEVFTQTLLMPLSPKSDQIGRCTDPALRDALQTGSLSEAQFMQGQGLQWLHAKLRTASVEGADHKKAEGHSFENLLTKIRTTSAFGTTVWQLMSTPELRAANADALAALLTPANQALAPKPSKLDPEGRPVGPEARPGDELNKRFSEFQARTRNATFDDPIARARRERVPLVGGQPLQDWQYESAAKYGLGFGQVIQPAGVSDAGQRAALEAELRAHGGVNGVPRQGQPILDGHRPTTLSEAELVALPEPFRQAELPELLQSHRLQHGTGVNRWEPYGSFAEGSAGMGFPSAGAQSGGTCDILLALHCMSAEPLYGRQKEVLAATVGIAAFMNFGAYHTFAETLPIGQAVASNQKAYVPNIGPRQENLYSDFSDMVRRHVGDDAHRAVQRFKQAYDAASNLAPVRQPEVAADLYLTQAQYDHFAARGELR